MNPERKWIGKRHKIEEYYWAGRMVVYVNNSYVGSDFDKAVRLAKRSEDTNDFIDDFEGTT